VPSAQRAAAPEKAGVVFVASGIGGFDLASLAAPWVLPHAGVPHEVRIFPWTHGKGHHFRDLQDLRHLLEKAGELARLVREFKEAHPDRPVYLVGRSGGAGLVLAAAEQLPPATLERIILIAPAVSPNYDLRPALTATRQEIVSFYSPNDWLILGWGTSHFGTEDRVYGPSAGLLGFRRPVDGPAEARALYERLVQIRWNARMLWEGHSGGHFGTSSPAFLAKEIAPWLKP
jgi:pimeloyl-ACP methyl ester carboxylesterase